MTAKMEENILGTTNLMVQELTEVTARKEVIGTMKKVETAIMKRVTPYQVIKNHVVVLIQ